MTSSARTPMGSVAAFAVGVLLLGGCMAHERAVVAQAPTADAKEVTARNLASCREQAQAAKMSENNPGYGRFIDDCMKKGGLVSR